MTPKQLGFSMPAEWEDHAACWVAWPTRNAAHYGFINEARIAYSNAIHAINDFEPVKVVIHPRDINGAKKILSAQVELFPAEIDDAWMRDSGPTFVKNSHGEIAGIDWIFNAWGRKYAPWDNDDAIAGIILKSLAYPRFLAPLVLEGGSIHSNGNGVLLTTKQCLLHKNRNPRLNQSDIETLLTEYLGMHQFVWIEGDDKDDETDGHVDNVACFSDTDTIMLMENPDDVVLTQNHTILKSAKYSGKPFNLITLPDPCLFDNKGNNLIASYVNFYFANGGIVMPQFGVKHDNTALAIMQETFPNRKIATVNAIDIVRGGGGLHCITQQQPL